MLFCGLLLIFIEKLYLVIDIVLVGIFIVKGFKLRIILLLVKISF